ncbi:MAG: hypothetical protein J6Z02_03160 [Lachnospiraceae bacterium]|nr:hypothetical protein [Lachnospiraceae bacterium]
MKEKLISAVIMLLVVGMVLFAFYKIATRPASSDDIAGKTEAMKILDKDIENNYPSNAREVVKFYNRIIKCYYDEPHTDEEIKSLAMTARVLFDTELLKRNPSDEYVAGVMKDIEDYKAAGRVISTTEVQDYKDVVFLKKGEYNTATVVSYYLVKDNRGSKGSNMKFYLREDEEGKWRILFFELTDDTL